MSFKLLPKSTEEFSDTKFWEGFFKTRGSKAFEWYGEYQDMLELWAQYAKPGDRVLNIGCGNSELGAELHDRQGCEVLCVDTSATVVQQMTRKHCSGERRPRLTYRVMDAARLEGLEDAGFACAVDKGTLDALMSASAGGATAGVVDAMLAEAHRVLRVGGRHLIVSLCQRQVVDKLLEHVTARPWIARVHQVASAASTDSSGFPLPVFFIALTKLRPGSQTMVQALDAYSTGPPERLESVASLADWIRRAQLTAYSLARPSAAGDVAAGGETRFAYACGRTGLDAYSCRLLSHASPSRRRSGYAVFIEAPSASTATSSEQRRRLLESQASLRRLLCVRLHPWLYYESDAAIQAALSRLVMAFAPRPGMPESEVPFLSSGRLAYPYKTVEKAGRFFVEVSNSGGTEEQAEMRLVYPDSDLAQLQCRATSVKLQAADAAEDAGRLDSLSGLLSALLGDAEQEQGGCSQLPAAAAGWPCDLDWLLGCRRRAGRVSLHRLAAESAPQPLLDQLADRCLLDYRAAATEIPPNRSLVFLFPPADSLAAYATSLAPETLNRVVASVAAGGRLLVATRLYDRKAPVLEANAAAAAALRACGRFSEVACATFCVASEVPDDAADCCPETEGGGCERLCYWVACASGTAESAERAAQLLADLPGAVVSRRPPAE